MLPHPETRPGLIGMTVTLLSTASVCLTAGCSTGTDAPAPRQRLSASDFAAPDAAPAAAPLPRPSERPEPRLRVVEAEAERIGPRDVIVLTGPPSSPPPGAVSGTDGAPSPGAPEARPARDRADSLLKVDQLVGQINGRPVYADEFFAPMDERLRREAERLPAREWLAMARKDIEAALWDKLRDELLLAEFESNLSPQERMGIGAFIEGIRRDFISGNLGSPDLANQRLRETEELGLDEKVKDVAQREFIAFQLRKAIGDRVSVSSRDIELYYEQNIEQFIPAPVARFIILRVPLRDGERLRQAEEALAAGEPFRQVAARFSTWRPDHGNTTEVELKGHDYASATLFGPRPLNEAARALAPGRSTERIDFSGDAYWVHLDEIERKPGRSLFEVQTEIERRLKSEREREELARYFEQLFRRGSFSDVKQMQARLFEFAADRYLLRREAGRAGGGGG